MLLGWNRVLIAKVWFVSRNILKKGSIVPTHAAPTEIDHSAMPDEFMQVAVWEPEYGAMFHVYPLWQVTGIVMPSNAGEGTVYTTGPIFVKELEEQSTKQILQIDLI